ncbi:MAG: RhuM family protein [Anaerohalosphaeraceae bacterium]
MEKHTTNDIVIYRAEDGKTQIDVNLKNETVWITQKQMALLFGTERSVVTKHINNILKIRELQSKSVCAKFAHTAVDGKLYHTNFYNLDTIISVGYRVNSKRGTQFRIWATTLAGPDEKNRLNAKKGSDQQIFKKYKRPGGVVVRPFDFDSITSF